MLFMVDDLFGDWQTYRRIRGGRWQFNPMWGWVRDEKPRAYPDPDVEDYRSLTAGGSPPAHDRRDTPEDERKWSI